MPRLSTAPVATATTTTEVKIQPALKKKLLTNLRAYQEACEQIAVHEAAKEHASAKVREIREQVGEDKLEIEGFTTANVTSTYTKLNKQKFVELGGVLAILDEATETLPKKPFEKITTPKKPKVAHDE